MKTTHHLFSKIAALVAIGFLGFVTSCKESEITSGQDVVDSGSESLTESYFQDADDVSLYSIDNNSEAGRIAADFRLTCATITPSGTVTAGTVIIDFGTGCTDSKGNVRKGKINLAYANGPAGTIGFTVTETFTEYSINGIKLQGQRVIKRVEAAGDIIKHSIKLTEGRATWPDNTYATRGSEFTRAISPANGTVTLSGSASGLTRRNKPYSAEISNLLFKKTCIADGIYMASQGTKAFVIDGKNPIVIDYGTGSCDKKVTITVNGVAKEITIANN